MGKKESVGKGSTASTAELSPYDRDHIGEILQGSGDWFSAQLLRLIAKADWNNRERIRLGFPEHVAAYDAWFRGEGHD